MHLAASDLYSYYRPSECRLRVYLRERHEQEDKPSPYEGVILRLGERHEAAHLAQLHPVIDLRNGKLGERAEITRQSLLNREPSILYHGVLKRETTIAAHLNDVFGEPDFIIIGPQNITIRDCKIAKRVN